MKILFASDLHGSKFYCNVLKNIICKEKPDKIVLLGDILYHGPRNPLPKHYNPQEVFKTLNTFKEKIICVRGNCDSEVDQMVLEFPIISDYNIINVDGINLFLTHGHIYNKDNMPNIGDNDILIHGHTHINIIEKLEKGLYINPGSISMPKENQENSYMIYEDKKFIIKNIEGKELKSIQI
ncbi:phosphodiesterase [[Clostridium] colinum]|uniref:phosphodiesterase n=1 Tax=[Clostridium] colinum TaxID=36835 RepID=UPI0020259AB8|nr:phosphodiesterase [[Clostridium] colinum]